MRRFICVILAAAFMLAACAGENLPQPPEAYPNGDEDTGYIRDVEMPPREPDFYDEIRDRGARIVASFDFEGFSVWFAITPEHRFLQMADGDFYRWDFANGANRGIPLTVAVVRNSAGRYILVEEVPANLDLRLYDWLFDEMPDRLPWMQNHHLEIRDGYMLTNFVGTGVFRGDNWLRRQALMVHTGDTMSLLYQTPMGDLSADNNILRHVILNKEGVIADSSAVTRANYTSAFYTLSDFDFAPQTNTITLGRITANADGITEAPYEIEFEFLAEGELTRIDDLLGLSALEMQQALWMGWVVPTDLRHPIINGRMYNFPIFHPETEQASELRLDSFDLATNAQIRDRLVHDFSPETVRYYFWSARGMTVHTDAAAYLFDNNFELIRRVEWPQYTSRGIFDDTFTFLAFRGTIDDVNGVFLYNFATNQPPALLHETIPHEWAAERHSITELGEFLHPLLFLDDERLFAAVSSWTGFDSFRIIDFSGNLLEEFPFGASGAYAGGFAFPNASMVIFEPWVREAGPHYFDFESGILSFADWWGRGENEDYTAYIPYPNNPRIWYVSNIERREGMWGPGSQLRASILRLDFENKTARPVLTMPEMSISLMSVGPNGELIFAFANDMDNGFAVFHPAR